MTPLPMCEEGQHAQARRPAPTSSQSWAWHLGGEDVYVHRCCLHDRGCYFPSIPERGGGGAIDLRDQCLSVPLSQHSIIDIIEGLTPSPACLVWYHLSSTELKSKSDFEKPPITYQQPEQLQLVKWQTVRCMMCDCIYPHAHKMHQRFNLSTTWGGHSTWKNDNCSKSP